MSRQPLTCIDLPDGRVRISACKLPSNLQLTSNDATCRIVCLGDPQRHPIAWLWSIHPHLAACLPDAFGCVLIDLKQVPDEVQDAASLRSHIHGLIPRIEVLPASSQVELAPFLPALAPKHLHSDRHLKAAITRASALGDGTASIAIQSGLYLMNDCLDESHASSQSIEGEGRCGDYWHAIMHRREPDYGNAKYWFRQVGKHPIFERLPAIAARIIRERKVDGLDRLSAADWDPFHFVDLCERHARNEDTPTALALREIQGWEMALLLEQSVAQTGVAT